MLTVRCAAAGSFELGLAGSPQIEQEKEIGGRGCLEGGGGWMAMEGARWMGREGQAFWRWTG